MGLHEHILNQQPQKRVGLPALRYNGEIFTGFNHGEAFEELQLKYPNAARGTGGGIEEGFTTSVPNEFVNRKEALRIADAADQVAKADIGGRNELYSQDILKPH